MTIGSNHISRLKLLPIVVAALVVFYAGCSSDECLQNKTALPLAGFYDSAKPESKVMIDSLEVYGVGAPGDSVLWEGTRAVNQLYLPFRLDSDTTRYVFRYLQKKLAALNLTDTVTFIYSRDPIFVSSACGVSYNFEIKEIRNSGILIDSVSCPAGIINNMDTENLEIYFGERSLRVETNKK